MEQSCYKCGQAVEEGTPFCPHCSAPQIRVVVVESALSPAAAVALPGSAPATETVPAIAIPMSWPQFVRPCALAALIASVTMVLELVVPLIAILGAGFLAVAFYRRGAPAAAMNAKTGARMGALCGFFCFGLTAILGSLKVLAFRQYGELHQKLLEVVQQAAARYPDPQAQPTWDFLRSPTGLVFLLVCFLIFSFFVFLVLGVLGGTLGGAALGRREKD